jgi:NAD(P)-dependent dehydrogenase (short-subunit alcohol dehydrogenase family)
MTDTSSRSDDTAWSVADIGDQSGRVVVVTGANSGLGLEGARALAAAGAHVILAVRDVARGESAARDLDGDTEVRRLDLADLESVRHFATTFSGSIDVLINNAGVMGIRLARTGDGFERQIATNHLGHFVLTNLLLPHITDRVVTMSSTMHKLGALDVDDLGWQRRRYSRWRAYSASKLANLLFAAELQRRLAAADSPIRSLAAHPGWAATNLQSHTGNALDHVALKVGNLLLSQSAEQGAWPMLFAATADLPGGAYVGPTSLYESRGAPGFASRSTASTDEVLAADLWRRSEQLTGVRFGLQAAT